MASFPSFELSKIFNKIFARLLASSALYTAALLVKAILSRMLYSGNENIYNLFV